MSIHDETLHPRGQAGNGGQFRAKENSAPVEALNPRAELDDANTLYHQNTDQLRNLVVRYLRVGMPAGAARVEFELSDQGDYVYVARAFDANGSEIDIEDDYDTWAHVDDVVSHLGDPDDNRTVFRDLFECTDRQVFTWIRSEPSAEAEAASIRSRIDRLHQTRQELGARSQAAAIVAVRRLLPEGAKATLTWGDQTGPDYLTVDKLTLADGSIVDSWESADDAGVDWDEIDMAASDIRDGKDPSLRVVDDRGMYFELDQLAA